MSHIPIHEAADIVSEVGRILLSSGATTNRVELMMRKAATCFGYGKTEAYVTPTGIFITVSDGSDKQTTSVQRSKSAARLGKNLHQHLINRLQWICKAKPQLASKLRAELYNWIISSPGRRGFRCRGGTLRLFACLWRLAEICRCYLVGVLVGAMRLARWQSE